MKIRETTRRLIIDELIMYGCVPGQMNVSDFVQRVYPKAMKMPTTDYRFGMTTAIEDIRQHMDNNDDWTFEYLFCTYLDLLHVGDDDFIYFLEQYTHPVIRRFNITCCAFSEENREENRTKFSVKLWLYFKFVHLLPVSDGI